MWNSVKKEVLHGIRTYRFLLIACVLLFFAFIDPMLQKFILPNVLMSQFGEMDQSMMDQMLVTTQRECIRAYYTNIYQIGTLVIALVLSGAVAGERKSGTMIIPAGNGVRVEDALTAKAVVYGGYLLLITQVAVVAEYFYTGLLFGFDISLAPTVRSGLYYGMYFVLVMTIVFFMGTFMKSPVASGMTALVPAFGMHFLSGVLNISKSTPSGLLSEAALLSDMMTMDVMRPMIVTVIVILALMGWSVYRIQRIELATR